MYQKTIQEAAENYSKDIEDAIPPKHKEYATQDFIAGAEWAIQQIKQPIQVNLSESDTSTIKYNKGKFDGYVSFDQILTWLDTMFKRNDNLANSDNPNSVMYFGKASAYNDVRVKLKEILKNKQ